MYGCVYVCVFVRVCMRARVWQFVCLCVRDSVDSQNQRCFSLDWLVLRIQTKQTPLIKIPNLNQTAAAIAEAEQLKMRYGGRGEGVNNSYSCLLHSRLSVC